MPQASAAKETESPVTGYDLPELFRLGIGIWGGGIVWKVHFLSIALIAEWGCFTGLGEWRWLGITGVAWTIVILSVLMSLACLGVAWLAWDTFKTLNRAPGASPSGEGADVYDRPGNHRSLAKIGLFSGLFFLVIILVQSVPVLFYLTEC